MKIDYKYKSRILKNTELINTEKLVSKSLYFNKNIINYKTGEIIMSLEKAKKINFDNYNNLDWKEARKINNCYYHRACRLRKRIENYLSIGNCIFLTLTFTNDTLKNTNKDTRKQYVVRYLKSCSDYYVANIDYGAKNHREHYHAIVVSDSVNYSLWRKYGAINGQRVRGYVCEKKLSKYISKLTNHAIKETTKRNAIIYSSKNKSNVKLQCNV